MKVTLLGTGTSQGIPVIGCSCSACTSVDPRDNRLRSSVLIESNGVHLLIDTSPDLRMQMLDNDVQKIDAILYTHEHNDHVIGLDDIRPFNFKQKTDMPLIGLERVMKDIQYRFSYVFGERVYPGAPRAIAEIIDGNEDFTIKGINVTPIKVMHGLLPILGYRFGDFSFITDASFINEHEKEKIRGSRFIVLNALQKKPHHSHFSLVQAIDFLKDLKPEKAFLTHSSHLLGPTKEWEKELPDFIFPAYDGLEIEC